MTPYGSTCSFENTASSSLNYHHVNSYPALPRLSGGTLSRELTFDDDDDEEEQEEWGTMVVTKTTMKIKDQDRFITNPGTNATQHRSALSLKPCLYL